MNGAVRFPMCILATVLLLFGSEGTAFAQVADMVPLSERGFWVIQGTESPDGRWGLAWGQVTDRVSDGSRRRTGPAPEKEGTVANYVVDLHADRAIAETGGSHARSEQAYNQNHCAAHWSPDSRTVLQVTTFKDRYGEAWLVRLPGKGQTDAMVVDWQAVANQAANAFLRQKKNPVLETEEEFAIRLLYPVVANGQVSATVWGEIVGKPGRESSWAVRVTAMASKAGWKVSEVRYPHQGLGGETELSHHSPDGRYAMQTTFESGHGRWSSRFIHGIDLVELPTKRVVTQLLPAAELGTNFSGLRLVWSSDSTWCAFYFAYPGRGGYPAGETIAFRKSGQKFLAASQVKKLRAAVLPDQEEGRLSEDVAPVHWIGAGQLLLKQTWHLVWDTKEPVERSWRFEADFSSGKRGVIQQVKPLAAEDSAALEREIKDHP